MSYILEALRKAESERERGLVPGLNAQPLGPADGAQVQGSGSWRAWAPWLIAAVAVLVAGVLAWTWRGDPADPPVAVVSAPVPAPATLPERPAPIAAPSVAPTGPPRSAMPVQPAPLVSRPMTAPTTTGGSVKTQQPTVVTKPASAAASSTATPAPVLAEQRIYTLADLPDATRRQLPPLAIAGASYSERPANRLLIVNGNVFHEGDTLATDLVLEHIDLKSAVLRFRDVRFSVTY